MIFIRLSLHPVFQSVTLFISYDYYFQTATKFGKENFKIPVKTPLVKLSYKTSSCVLKKWETKAVFPSFGGKTLCLSVILSSFPTAIFLGMHNPRYYIILYFLEWNIEWLEIGISLQKMNASMMSEIFQ